MLFLGRFVVLFCLKDNKLLSCQIKCIANCDILYLNLSEDIILKKLLLIVLVICCALVFTRRRSRCLSEQTSTNKAPSSDGFANPTYQYEPEYQEVGENAIGRNDANNYELWMINHHGKTVLVSGTEKLNQIIMKLNKVGLFVPKNVHRSNWQTLLYSV